MVSDHCFVVRPKKVLWLVGATPRGYLSRMAMTHTTHGAVGAGAVGGERFGMRLTDCSSQIEQSNVPAPATAMSTADATGVGEGLSRFASQSQYPPWAIGSRAGLSKIWGSVANEELIAIPFFALVRDPPQSQLGSAATAREPKELPFPVLSGA